MWRRKRPVPPLTPAQRKRVILAGMDLAELADIGLKPADVERLQAASGR